MRYLLAIIFLSLPVFSAQNPNLFEIVNENYQQVLEDHYQWQKDHKHEDLDAYYYYRIGYLDACIMIMEALDPDFR